MSAAHRVGTARRVNPDGTVRVDLEWRPSALILAGSHEQALTWALEMGFEPSPAKIMGGKAAALCWPESMERLRNRGVHRAREAFFVGKWESLPVEPLARLWLDLEVSGTPITYVTAPDGELVARKDAWFRWNAPSSKQPTRLHLLRRAPGDEGKGPNETLVSACGLRVTAEQLRTAPLWRQVVRWGPPPDACGICAHEAGKMPPGTHDSRNAALAMAAYHLAMLRAYLAGIGRAASEATWSMDEFLEVAARDLDDLSRQPTTKGDDG